MYSFYGGVVVAGDDPVVHQVRPRACPPPQISRTTRACFGSERREDYLFGEEDAVT